MEHKKNNEKKSLKVNPGVDQPSAINPDVRKRFVKRTSVSLDADYYAQGIKSGDRTILGKAITLIESSLPKHQEAGQQVLEKCLPFAGNSIRVGITGVPGVGKSTFIEALGQHLSEAGKKIAVLAVDPSSMRSKGSILGDKTRMEQLAGDPNAFIRPSPSAGSLGGVARKTRETIMLCEASGFDVIIVETVGVGQSETAVYSMVDFFLLLMLAGAGDELQGIKRGIMEMADAIVINKADSDNLEKARLAKAEYANALHLFSPPESGWDPRVDICSALTGMGIENVWKLISDYNQTTKANGYFQHKRKNQLKEVLYDEVQSRLREDFFTNKEVASDVKEKERLLLAGQISPYTAANQLISSYFRNKK